MDIVAVAPGPNFSVADVHAGWVEALRSLGCRVSDFNLDRRLDFYSQAQFETEPGQFRPACDYGQAIQMAVSGLLSACYQLRPDVLLVTSCFYVGPDALDLVRSHGTRVVLLHTESPYEDDRQQIRAAHADLNLINDPTHLDQFSQIAPTYYVPHAYRPSVHYPRDLPTERDFVFVGTGYPSRIEFLEQVDWSGIYGALAGNWQGLNGDSPLRPMLAHSDGECCPNDETALLYGTSKLSANLYRRESTRPELSAGWAMGPREVELAAMGVFYLRESRGESDEILPMLPTFAGPDDLGDQIRWWAAHDDSRREAADKARQAVADRTFANHARQLLQLLGA